MPLITDLSQAPYFDDQPDSKEFVHVGFKPGSVVQARELNEMQRLLRLQVERFGDAVFQTGTIVDGCNFQYIPDYQYVKLRDQDQAGMEVATANCVGLFVTNDSTGLSAFVTDYRDGFEASAPNLKTLYLRYRGAGSNGATYSFSPGDVLRLSDSNSSVASVSVTNSGIGFSNVDYVVITPLVAVQVTSGSFSAGDYVTQPSTGANLYVAAVNSTALASSGWVLLTLQARAADLSNAAANGAAWAVANNDSIRNSGNTAVGTVVSVYGSGAEAVVVTDGSGRVASCPVTSGGAGYLFAPQAQVRSANNGSVASAVLLAKNYYANLVVANTSDAVGSAYGFGVSEGVAYARGCFLRVDAQSVVVSPYSNTPSNVAVALTVSESIVTADADPSLLDNAIGSENYTAPGADRLRASPALAVVSPDSTDALVLTAWSEGLPYKQNQATAYSRIGDEMARRTFETSGDFSVDLFQVTTRSTRAQADEGSTLSIVVDPGLAYVDGYRVSTSTNYAIDVDKGTDSSWSNGQSVTTAYGDWVRVGQLGGVFQFSTADSVALYDTAKGYLSNLAAVAAGDLSPVGSQIGSARVRMMEPESGPAGSANATQLMYLFDVVMSAGKRFQDVRSVAWGANGGVADVVLEYDPTTGANNAVLHDTKRDALLFDVGADAPKTLANVSYSYRTVDQTVLMANTGLLTKSLSGSATDFFAQNGAPLTSAQLQTLRLVPKTALQYSANVAGTVTANGSSPNLVGSSTTFLSDLVAGDYVYVYANSTVHDVRRVSSVVNNTLAVLDANCGFSQAGVALYRYFPAGVAVPLGWRSGLAANTDSTHQLLTIDMGGALAGSTSANCSLAVDVARVGASPATKTAVRSRYVKLSLANNAGGVAGPWCLGVPDLLRLRGVWLGSNSSVDTTYSEVTDEFFADSGQLPTHLDLAFLYQRPASPVALSSSSWLLVGVDYLTSSTGYFCATSYVSSNAAVAQVTDSTPLANLGTSVASVEVPEVYAPDGRYWDLLDCLDFRPIAVATASPATNASSAPVNPAYSLGFGNTADPSTDRKFPSPGYSATFDMEAYAGRVDSVYVGHDGNVLVARGSASTDPARRRLGNAPRQAMKVNDVYVPAWPTLPVNMSLMQAEVATTRVYCDGQSGGRIRRKTAQPMLSVAQVQSAQPRRYTNADVGSIDDRVAALEYYASLSALETDMTRRVIPSSANAAVDRFKFGFFVDDFSTTVSQSSDDPQYAATVSGGRLKPGGFSWSVLHGSTAAAPSYVETTVASQNTATTPRAASVVAGGNATLTVANSYAWAVDFLPSMFGTDATGFAFINTSETFQFGKTDVIQFGENAGDATLYFHVPPTTVINGSGFQDPATFLIYQQNVLIADAATNAAAMTSTDAALLLGAGGPQGGTWFYNEGLTPSTQSNFMQRDPLTVSSSVVGGFKTVSGWGKITWTHNPAAGLTYTIVSNVVGAGDSFKWSLRYPSGQVVSSTQQPLAVAMAQYSAGVYVNPPVMALDLVPTNPPASTAGQSVTQLLMGSFATGGEGNFSTSAVVQGVIQSVTNATQSARASLRPQSFAITAWGLLPSATHVFYVQGIDKSSRVRPVGGSLGDPLVTGADGTLSFTYYYDAAVDQDVTVQLLSNTAFLAQAPTATATQSQAAGSLRLELRAPNSVATYKLPVFDLDVPVQYLGNPS